MLHVGGVVLFNQQLFISVKPVGGRTVSDHKQCRVDAAQDRPGQITVHQLHRQIFTPATHLFETCAVGLHLQDFLHSLTVRSWFSHPPSYDPVASLADVDQHGCWLLP